MEQQQTGSKAYLFSIVMVAVLGGLLFGYDTAVISGAEKGLQAFFKGAGDFEYTDVMHGFTSSSALIGCIIGSSLSGLFASRLGRKRSLMSRTRQTAAWTARSHPPSSRRQPRKS